MHKYTIKITQIAVVCSVIACSVCRGQVPSPTNTVESNDAKYLTNHEREVSIEIPAVGTEASGLAIGDGVGVAIINDQTEINPTTTSVFTDECLATVKPTRSVQTLALNYAENYSSDSETKKFAQSMSASAGGFWGSASAHYNREKFESKFHNKLVHEIRLISDATTDTLHHTTSNRDLSIFRPEVANMIKQARQIVDSNDSDKFSKLADLRRNFALIYGNSFVVQVHNGAQLIIRATQQLMTGQDIEKTKSTFAAATGGLSSAFGQGRASGAITKDIKKAIENRSVKYDAFLQGAGGELPIGEDRQDIIKFVNEGLSKQGWFKTAQTNPAPLTLILRNYSAIGALSILAQPSEMSGTLAGTRELLKARIYPIMDGEENDDYSAAATFLQYSNGFGMLDYVWIPLPRPEGKISHTQSTVSIPLKVPSFFRQQDLIATQWQKEAKPELGGDTSDDRLYFLWIDRPKMLTRATMTYEFQYDPDVAEADQLKLSGGRGDTYTEYPPDIGELYNRYPEDGSDIYSFDYRGSPQAVTKFLGLVKSGILVRPVIDMRIQRIKLDAFKLQAADDLTIQRPKRIERVETSDALRRLVNLEESKVSKDSLRRSGEKKLDAKRCIQTNITEIPGFSRIRMVAVGKIDIFERRSPPRYYADFENGKYMEYYKAAINSGPEGGMSPPTGDKIGKGLTCTWENQRAEPLKIMGWIRDTGCDDNSGSFTIYWEVAPLNIPFSDLPKPFVEQEEARKSPTPAPTSHR